MSSSVVLSSVRSLWSSLLTARDERIVRRAARAEADYWRLVRSVDDQRRRTALIHRRVEWDAEVRGAGPVALPVPDLSISLEEAVQRELVAITPRVQIQVQRSRKIRRLASECGPTQLELAVTPAARRQLRAIVGESGLCIREIAGALGVAPRTLERHVAGETMSRERRDWYHRLIRIFIEGHEVHVVTRALAPTRKPWGWNLGREAKRRLFASDGIAPLSEVGD